MDGSAGEAKRASTIPHWKLVLDQARVTPEVLKWEYEGSGTDDDPYIVDWIDDDPGEPMGFPKIKKWFITLLVAFATLTVAFVSSAYTGGIRQVIEQFRVSQEVVTLGVSLFVLGFAIGPLLWAPMSELWGRQLLYFGTYAMLTAFNAGAAGSQNIQTLIILRFFAGAFGSSPLTNAGGVIADMFAANERGIAMSIFSAAPFMGPVIGPIVGGFLGETEGWRWVEGLMAIFTGVLWILGTLLIPETYPPVLLRKRAAALSKVTGKVYRSRVDVSNGKVSAGEAFRTALSRPWILLFREPIVLLLSIYMAIIYGTLYMLFGAFPIVYQEYRGWSEGIGGLAFLGVAVGMILAVLYTVFVSNKGYLKAATKAGGLAPPEARLPPGMVGSVVLPIGLFWFAWTNYPSIHWIVSIIAGAPFGFGMVLIFLSMMNYLIDAYTIFAASVLAANSVLRSLFGAAFPLFTTQMYANLGIHWASTVPAFLALACVPFPFLFYAYGPVIRKRCKFAAEADAFLKKVMARQQKDVAAGGQEEETHDLEKGGEAAAEDGTAARRRPSEAESVEDKRRQDIERPREDAEEPPQEDALMQEGREEAEGRFQRIKTAPEQGGAAGAGGRNLHRVSSRRSTRSNYDNPYDIDYVDTRETFARGRSKSDADRRSTRSGRE